MTLDPESASLLEQAQREGQRQGSLTVSATAPTTSQADVSLSVGETRVESWGQWAWRVTGAARFRRGAKPDASVTAEGEVRW